MIEIRSRLGAQYRCIHYACLVRNIHQFFAAVKLYPGSACFAAHGSGPSIGVLACYATRCQTRIAGLAKKDRPYS